MSEEAAYRERAMTDSSTTAAQSERASLRLGLLLGIGAYALWGLFPLFFPLLKPASPLEIARRPVRVVVRLPRPDHDR